MSTAGTDQGRGLLDATGKSTGCSGSLRGSRIDGQSEEGASRVLRRHREELRPGDGHRGSPAGVSSRDQSCVALGPRCPGHWASSGKHCFVRPEAVTSACRHDGRAGTTWALPQQVAVTCTECDSAVPRLWRGCWTRSPDRTTCRHSALTGDSSWLWQRSPGPDKADSRPGAAAQQGRVGRGIGEEGAVRGDEASSRGARLCTPRAGPGRAEAVGAHAQVSQR